MADDDWKALEALAGRQIWGFWSYSRKLEQASGQLQAILEESLNGALGRTPEATIFRDVHQSNGTRWRGELVRAIRRSVLFFWLQSPAHLRSDTCRFELQMFRAQVARIAQHFGVPGQTDRLLEKWTVPIRWQGVHRHMWPALRGHPAIRDIAWLWDDSQVLNGHFDIARHGHSEASYREHGIAMGTEVRDKLFDSLQLLGEGSPFELLDQLLAFVSQEDFAFERHWLDRIPGDKPPGGSQWPDGLRMAPYDLTLRPGETQELVEVLTDAFGTREALSDLAEELGTSLKPGGELQGLALALIATAERHGALRWLVRAARMLQPSNDKLIAFEGTHFSRCVDRDGEAAASQVGQLDTLIGIVDELGDDATATTTDRVAEAFAAVTGRTAPAWDRVPVSGRVYRAGLIGLAAEPDGRDPPALVRFVREMQDRTPDAAVREKLAQWLESVGAPKATVVPAPPPAPPAAPSPVPPSAVPAPSSGQRYVMVRVKPVRLGERYEVNAWLWVDQEPRVVWDEEKVCRNLSELREALAAELRRSTETLAQGLRKIPAGQITYEFILPRALIDAEVDQWEIARGGLPLGTVHRVIVRSYERIHEMDIEDQDAWTEKWEAWRQSKAAAGTVWFDPARERTNHKLKLRLHPPHVVAMASCGPFPASRNDDPLMTGLTMGLPIIVWPRRSDVPGTRAQIESFLQQLGGDPCGALLRMRADAVLNDDTCLTTLLWDDPDRRPPDLQPLEDVPTA